MLRLLVQYGVAVIGTVRIGIHNRAYRECIGTRWHP